MGIYPNPFLIPRGPISPYLTKNRQKKQEPFPPRFIFKNNKKNERGGGLSAQQAKHGIAHNDLIVLNYYAALE